MLDRKAKSFEEREQEYEKVKRRIFKDSTQESLEFWNSWSHSNSSELVRTNSSGGNNDRDDDNTSSYNSNSTGGGASGSGGGAANKISGNRLSRTSVSTNQPRFHPSQCNHGNV